MKKHFSILLYVEGLKKLRVVGILGIILTAAASIILFINNSDAASVNTLSVSLLPLLILAPTLTISAFSFLHNRKGSDFYHSLPVSRVCMFSSFFLAAFSWMAAAVLICCALCGTTTIILDISPAAVFVLIPAYLLACLLLSGISALAVSATGTSFAATILFVFSIVSPVLFADLLMRLFSSLIPSYAAQEDFLSVFFFDNTIIGELYTYNGESSSLLWGLHLYILTLLVSLIFIGGALLLFTRRQSEWAARPAPGAGVRVLCKCLATLPISTGYSFYCLYCLEEYSNVNYKDSFFITLSIVAAILCVFIWFLLELLFTKKIKLALLSLPQLFLAFGFCALFILSFAAGKKVILNFIPKASQIHSFSVNYNLSSGKDYSAKYLSDIFVADDELEKILCDSLASTNENIKSGSEEINWPYVTVRFKLYGGITIARKVTLNDISISELKYRSALANEKFMEKYLILPINPIDANFLWFGAGFSSNDSGVTALSIWNTFASEYNSLSPEQKLEVMRSSYSPEDRRFMPYITASFKENDIYSGISVFIPEYMVNTRQNYFTILKHGTDNTHKDIYEELPNFGTASYELVNCDTMIFANGKLLFGGSLVTDDNDRLKEIFNVILSDGKITESTAIATESYVTLDMEWLVHTVNGDAVTTKSYTKTAALSINEETARILSDMLKNGN